jgi:hypothetical protein
MQNRGGSGPVGTGDADVRRGDLRLQAAAVSSVRRRSSAGPPLPLLISFTYSGAAAPNPRRGSDGRACGMRFTPPAAKGSAPGRRPWSPPSPLLLPLLRLLLLPHFLSFLRWTGRNSHGAAAQYKEEDGRLLVGWRLGFGARERAAGIPFRGAWRPSGAPALQGRGGGHGGAGAAHLLPPRPHGVRHGIRQEGGKVGEKES